jgi:hypothetical protein
MESRGIIRKLLPVSAFAVTLVLVVTIWAAVQSTPAVKAAGSAPEKGTSGGG